MPLASLEQLFDNGDWLYRRHRKIVLNHLDTLLGPFFEIGQQPLRLALPPCLRTVQL
jgi:hypothetical protein